MRLQHRIAIVTGGGYGIGRAIALAFAREGADLVLAARNRSRLEETAREVQALGRRALVQPTDVSQEDEVRAMVQACLAAFGRVDILVNNAGIAGPTKEVADLSATEWDETLNVNLRGAFLCAKYALQDMRQRRQGVILNIGSVAGRIGYPRRAPYAASKWGMIGLNHALAAEVGRYNIRVNCLCPGTTAGERLSRVIAAKAEAEGTSYAEAERWYTQQIPLGRVIQPEEIASVAVFLASDESSGMTGQCFTVCGGFVMH
ncbi:MAG: 3-ketoacyl-ACP reductase [Candidatus Tectimicrobiota bacterium]|nr:MAG: 3-ketoacyl-ACP reductase [Candidatus Tectomicrobia bacterium]